MSADQTLIEVALARMEGKLDLLAQGQEHLREAMRGDRAKQALLEQRVTELEKAGHIESGEKSGIEKIVKIIYATCGLVGMSAIAAAVKYIL
jgi:hypothetical protein